GDRPPGLVEGSVRGARELPYVKGDRTVAGPAPGLAGDEGELVGEAIMELPGDPPSFLGGGVQLELLVCRPVGQGQLEQVAQGRGAFDTLVGERASPAGQ